MAQKDCDKRPRYFAGQYLLEDDFELEQNYHIDRQRRHNRLLHVSGIADGLIVTPGNDLTVKISAGTAIDKNGRQIVWSADMENEPVKLQDDNNNNAIANGKYILLIEYFEKELSNSLQEGTTDGYTRWYELPNFKLVPDGQPLPEDFIALAKLSIDGKTVTIDDSDKNIRQYSGLRLPSTNQTNAPTLRSGGDQASNLAVLSGGLSVTGNVGIGTTSPTEKLEISGGNLKVSENIFATNANLSGNLAVTGNVGIGITSPEINLHINGPSATTDLNNPKPWPIETQELLRLVRPPSSVVVRGQNKSANSVGLFVGTFEEKSLGGTRFDITLSDYTSAGYGLIPNIKVMTLQSNGNVGIGTISPTEKLEISGGNLKVSGNISATDATLTSKVGIGTASPTEKLEISGGNLKVSGDISATNTNLSGNLCVTGNIGIGTISPAAKLQVRDTIASRNNYDFSRTALLLNSQTHNGGNSPAEAESVLALAREGVSGQTFGNMVDFRLSNHQNAGTQLDLYLTKLGTFLPQQVMSLRANGTVGIGTTNPAEKLEISGGNLKVSGIISSQQGFKFPDGTVQLTAGIKVMGGTFEFNLIYAQTTQSQKITLSGFTKAPIVFVSFSYFQAANNRQTVNFTTLKTYVDNINQNEFTINLYFWGENAQQQLGACGVTWIAFGV
ncbi:hypothetical protein NIES2107_11240 [Nostoc carneum NIES-2107]|nr:hypothetical protein NIES2107_11240 [Nostoc carneum NIES-2107]